MKIQELLELRAHMRFLKRPQQSRPRKRHLVIASTRKLHQEHRFVNFHTGPKWESCWVHIFVSALIRQRPYKSLVRFTSLSNLLLREPVRPISQIPQCIRKYPTMPPFVREMWDIELMHCGISKIGLIYELMHVHCCSVTIRPHVSIVRENFYLIDVGRDSCKFLLYSTVL